MKIYAVVDFPGDRKVVASVSTTSSKIILALGDGRKEHYTYPPDGRFHVTTEQGDHSARSFYAPGPSFDALCYYRFALVAVPMTPAALTRAYTIAAKPAMSIAPPHTQEGMLEVGIVGQKASSDVFKSLSKDGCSVVLVGGPRSDTTIFFRYNP